MKNKKPLVLILGVLLAAALIVGLIFGIKALSSRGGEPAGDTTGEALASGETEPGETEPGETTPVETIELTPEMIAAKTKSCYTADDLSEEDPRLDQVVAECGDYTLTSRQAQVYYVFSYYNFMNNYGLFLGVDETKPFSEQAFYDTSIPMNYEQYFLLTGLQSFQFYAAAATEANAKGYELPEEDRAELESALSGLEEEAATYGYSSADEYLRDSFGPYSGMAEYENYLRTYFQAMSYENSVYESLTWTDEDLKAYYDAHPDDFANIDPETLDVNVRHILITYEVAEDATDEEVEAARAAAQAKAEALLADYLKDPSEENFAALAAANSEDPGSVENGGLYEDVYPNQMVQAFNDWCFDEARQPGDTGVVETSYGFHVMYFAGQSEKHHWESLAEQNLPGSMMDALIDESIARYPMTVRYEDLVLAPLPQPETE